MAVKSTAMAVAPAVLEGQHNARAAFRNPRNEPLIGVGIWVLERRGKVPEVGSQLRRKLAKGIVKVFVDANDEELDLMIDGARGSSDEGVNLFVDRLNDEVGGTFLDLLLQLLPLLLPLITCL